MYAGVVQKFVSLQNLTLIVAHFFKESKIRNKKKCVPFS